MPNSLPWPGEFHPWYERHRPWLADWLNRVGPYADRDAVVVPVWRPFRVSALPPDPDDIDWNDAQDLRTILLTRRTAWALAPYVGRPFVYAWHFVIDAHGRQLAGDQVRIEYRDQVRTARPTGTATPR